MLNKVLFDNKKQHFISWIILSIIVEVLFFIKIMNSESTIMKIGGLLIVPLFTLLSIFMLESKEKCFYGFAFVFPALPISGYVFLRIGLIDYQWITYLVIFFIFLASLIKNKAFQNFKIKVTISKLTIFILVLAVFLLINIISAHNSQTSFLILLFGIIPTVLFFFLYDKIIDSQNYKYLVLSLCIGIIVSTIPDFVTYIYFWLIGLKIYRLYGPLGSNFMLGYLLLIFPIILTNYRKSEGIIKKTYLILTIIGTLSMASQYSRGIIVALVFTFLALLFDKKNIKFYLIIALIVFISLGINVSSRPELNQKNLTKIVKMQEKKNKAATEGLADFESGTRQPIWNAAIKMFKAHPVMGVGIGNFQYFFAKYSGINRPYLDAHNFILNSLAELGIVNTILILGAFGFLFFKCLGYLIHFKNRINKNYVNIAAVFSAIIGYFVFANITGATFQCAHEIHSYVPIFIIIFTFYNFNKIYGKNKVTG